MSKTLWVVGVGSALASALLWTGCSQRVGEPSKTAQTTASLAPQPGAPFNLDNAAGKLAPAFKLKDANGQTITLADYRGKVVLLDFWATWCGPCKIEIPWFMDFERQYRDKGLAVVGVSMDEDGWSAIRPYVANMKMNYRVLLGDDAVSTAYGGLDSLPTTFLIDRQGKIVSVHVGVSMGKKDFDNAIVQLLNAPRESVSLRSGRVLALLTRPDSQ